MKISHKFTITMVGCVLAALALNAWSAVHTEISRFEDELGANQAVIGRALRPAVTEVWRTDGSARALEIVQEADKAMKSVYIRWVWLLSDDDRWRPSLSADRLASVANGEQLIAIDRARDRAGRIYSYVPVSIPGQPAAAIEVSQPLDREAAMRWNVIGRSAISALIIAAASALLTSVLGGVLIGHPLGKLVEQARRTGGGDLTFRIRAVPRDEVGMLALEMNRMCDRLAEAQDRISRETEAKIRAVDQLRHADRLATVGRLAAGMAHELGTPLNVVGARAKSIAGGQLAPETAQDNARIIVEQVDRMARLMRQLLDFARKRDLQKTSTDLRTVARRAMSFLAPISKKRNVDLVLEQPETEAAAVVDGSQLEQVLTNLMINAIHASDAGQKVRVGITREVGTPPPEDARGTISCVRIDVQDAGGGIAEADLPRIFEPFFTTKPIGEGTGLGLSVAYGIVKDHGGWIEVTSRLGEGSCFTLWLPEEAA